MVLYIPQKTVFHSTHFTAMLPELSSTEPYTASNINMNTTQDSVFISTS